jgi:hypothetical protein
MPNENSTLPFGEGMTLDHVRETIGITKFSGANADKWAQVLGGVIIQGGKELAIPLDGTRAVAFQAPFPKQVLGIFAQAISAASGANEASALVNNITINGFDLVNDATQKDFYWWAIGI